MLSLLLQDLNFHDTQEQLPWGLSACVRSHRNHQVVPQPASLQQQPRQARRGCNKWLLWRISAAEDSRKGADVVDVQKIGVIPFSKDEETLVEVMAFAGPAPEVTQQAAAHGLLLM